MTPAMFAEWAEGGEFEDAHLDTLPDLGKFCFWLNNWCDWWPEPMACMPDEVI